MANRADKFCFNALQEPLTGSRAHEVGRSTGDKIGPSCMTERLLRCRRQSTLTVALVWQQGEDHRACDHLPGATIQRLPAKELLGMHLGKRQ